MSDKNALSVFAAGFMLGVVCAWLHTKNKYEKILQDEIDSVKKTFSKNSKSHFSHDEDEEIVSEIISDNSYIDIGAENKEDHPYVIPPEEFGEIEGYESISLTYYSDGVLADDGDFKIDNYEDTVGEDFQKHFGEYEDDSVYIRNDIRSCDYEILRDLRKYADVIKSKPYISEEQ